VSGQGNGVPGADRGFEGWQCVLVVSGREGLVLELLLYTPEVLAGLRDVGMAGVQSRLTDGEGPLVAGAGGRQISESVPYVPEVC
jgi:hypothetical protein